jgi:hypothetical protein
VLSIHIASDPKQARILDERRYFPHRRDLDHTLPIGVADIDVTRSVDRGAARGQRAGEAPRHVWLRSASPIEGERPKHRMHRHAARYLKREIGHQCVSGLAKSYDRGVEERFERKEPWT